MGLPYTINDGDTLIIQTDQLVQVSAITSFTESVGTVSGSPSIVKDFRYSIDGGTTFTAWATLSEAALIALSISSANPLQIEYRYAVTGGVIVVNGLSLGLTIDPNAPASHGMLSTATIWDDLQTVMKALVNSVMYQYTVGIDHYRVVLGHEGHQQPSNQHIIYIDLTAVSPPQYLPACMFSQEFELSVTVEPSERVQGYGQMLSRIIEAANYFNAHEFNVTLGAITRTGVKLSDLGITARSMGSRVYPNTSGVGTTQFRFTLSVNFPYQKISI